MRIHPTESSEQSSLGTGAGSTAEAGLGFVDDAAIVSLCFFAGVLLDVSR